MTLVRIRSWLSKLCSCPLRCQSGNGVCNTSRDIRACLLVAAAAASVGARRAWRFVALVNRLLERRKSPVEIVEKRGRTLAATIARSESQVVLPYLFEARTQASSGLKLAP
mmetsp:Transcript_10436/g.14870  ORF Transcript_10436/g.14870 Transcript_10436/m.14870 type:complete len:111 (+) Transcript_10436:173-505(+)